jgi:hypothetical protein
MALIYNYYESGIPIEPEGNKKYKCKVCVLINEKGTDGECFYAHAKGSTTSNLINHLKKASHSIQHEEYCRLMKEQDLQKLCSPANKKRKLDPNVIGSPATPKNHSMFNHVSCTAKYTFISILQKTRYKF